MRLICYYIYASRLGAYIIIRHREMGIFVLLHDNSNIKLMTTQLFYPLRMRVGHLLVCRTEPLLPDFGDIKYYYIIIMADPACSSSYSAVLHVAIASQLLKI